MPLLTTNLGMNRFYIDSLPDEMQQKAEYLIYRQEQGLAEIDDKYIKQYYIPMGYNVSCELSAGLPSSVYIAELRSTQAVHPTLRPIAQKIGNALENMFPKMALYVDKSEDEWSTVRGKHDITKKG